MNERIKDLRKSLNLTQHDFAKSINLSRSNIGNIEKGLINLTDRNISNICNVHNVNEEWLRTGVGDMFVEMDIDEEFSYLMGALAVEDNCDFKKKFIKAMLELKDESDWLLILDLVERLKK